MATWRTTTMIAASRWRRNASLRQWRGIARSAVVRQQAEQSAPWRESAARMQVFEESAVVGSEVFHFETGKLAQFASGAVVCGVGETKVLVTVVSDERLDAGRDFMPLQVEYREKSYAQGKIPNTFMRREGAPKERELLCGRVIDRSIRPLFPKGYYFETQIMANVICSDGDQDPDVLAANAASAALCVSDVPWNGPIGVVRIGRVNGKLIVNPDMDTLSQSDLNLIYSCTAERTLMIETQAREITNKDYIAALQLAHSEAVKLIEPQRRLAAKVGNVKRSVVVVKVDPPVLEKVRGLSEEGIKAVVNDPTHGKFERGKALYRVQTDVQGLLKEENHEAALSSLSLAFDTIKKQVVRRNVFESGVRVDGRSLTDVRDLYCEAGIYPALHGSSLFSRGNTQVLCTVTLGAPEDAQTLDAIVGPPKKRFMVHYSFPPFSVNEVGKVGGLNRREVGHGTLAEKALVALLPHEDENFPYSVRVNSEVMASDGSSSMATVCGGSMALMDAGIPLKAHVAGISVGLMTEVDSETDEIKAYRILTDILGLEDHLGDMDFKIAGTRKGVTAVQLDIKLPGVPLHILCEALEPALAARKKVLDLMEKEIPKPRVSQRGDTPRRGTLVAPRDSIGRLIGPQGSNIKNIQLTTGARLAVNEEGTVHIIARSEKSFKEAKQMVEALVGKEIQVGGNYTGTVSAIKDFGAFIDFDGGQQGLLHISEISHTPVTSISEVLKVGQEIAVVCIGRDFRGNLKFSHKATLSKPDGVTPKTVSALASKIAKLESEVASQMPAERILAAAATVETTNVVTTTTTETAARGKITRTKAQRKVQTYDLTADRIRALFAEKPAASENVAEGETSPMAAPEGPTQQKGQELDEKKQPTTRKKKALKTVEAAGQGLGTRSSQEKQEKQDEKKKRVKKQQGQEQEENSKVEVGSVYAVTVDQVRKNGLVVKMRDGSVGALHLGSKSEAQFCTGNEIQAICTGLDARKRPKFELRNV